jgi:hypothetical protein
MPVVGLLSLGRRVQYATRIYQACPWSFGNNARRSFSNRGHVRSDYLPVDEQRTLLSRVAGDSAPGSPDAPQSLYQSRRQDRLDPKLKSSTWSLSTSPQHDRLKAIIDRRLALLAIAVTSDTPGDTDFSLTERERIILGSLDYTEHHVDYYFNILSNKDSLLAARLLTETHAPPFFVYRDFLARSHIRPEALRILLNHLPVWDPDTLRLSDRLVLSVFESLLYHCRRVWPEALPLITVWLTQELRLSDTQLLHFQESTMLSDDFLAVSSLTTQYNYALRLLSSPSHISPFKNTVLQEAAQATILKHMADHTPALAINRTGYRAVIRVQLAAKKTGPEQEWARLKSPSWPPWKEDRTGMDAHIGLDHGVSRAHQILLRMQEAGYPLQEWDQIAMIYAGWDTDRSPTVQKRVFLDDLDDQTLVRSLWVARIKTTRTAQQAWACFLAYQDENLPPDHRIYHAMFEVLVEERKRLHLGPENIGHEVDDDHDGLDLLYPGDTKEIGSPPSSAHQLTYIRAEIPSIPQLYDHLREDGKIPSDDTLEMLMDSAESLAEGLVYLETGINQKYDTAVSALIQGSEDYQVLDVLPDRLFTAYIRLLCRFPHTAHGPNVKSHWSYGTLARNSLDLRQPLARALYLLVQQKRTYRPAWNCVFAALARRDAPTLASGWRWIALRNQKSLNSQDLLYDKIFAFSLARQVNETMKENDLAPDEDAFLDICIVAEHAASAVHAVFEMHQYKEDHTTGVLSRLTIQADTIFRQGPRWMKEHFRNLTEGTEGGSDSKPTLSDPEDAVGEQLRTKEAVNKLPSLYVVPRPALLHSYIRTLGLFRDYDGLLELVQWMIKNKRQLTKRRALDRRGRLLMRRALIALRVFVEGRWEEAVAPQYGDQDVVASASVEQIEEIRRLVNGVRHWGGWPSDDEIEMYVDYGRGDGLERAE